MKNKNPRYAFQFKLLNLLNDLSLRGKWNELQFDRKYFNNILTRFYINSYWKVRF